MKIEDINSWWKTSKIGEEYKNMPLRALFDEIKPYMDEKQIIALNGLRRTGKTVLMHHIIDFLLKSHEKEKILYYSFDLANKKIEEILKSYEELMNIDLQNEKVFVFLDEIQKHENWENEIKILYDNFKNIKFFISGSSSLFIEKKTKESLGGRVYSFVLMPLTFKEYLRLNNLKFNNLNIHKKEISSALKHYMSTGGFPELLGTKEEIKIDRYIKELVIDRVIHMDIPKVFNIEEPELLATILSIISSSPGMILDYESIAGDLNRNRKTISNYVFYLEKAFLVKKLYNYSRNLLTSEKKLKKIYPTSTAFSFLFNAKLGQIIETAILMNDNFKFFSRKRDKEVDFIKIDKTTLPIESKHTQKVRDRELKGLIIFLQENNLKEGVVITKNEEEEKTIKGKKIKFIPVWKWLLEN